MKSNLLFHACGLVCHDGDLGDGRAGFCHDVDSHDVGSCYDDHDACHHDGLFCRGVHDHGNGGHDLHDELVKANRSNAAGLILRLPRASAFQTR